MFSESWSLNGPRSNQVTPVANRWPSAMKCPATIKDRTKATKTAAIPVSAPPLGMRFPNSRIAKNDTSGRTTMIQLNRITPSPFQHLALVHVDGLAVAVDQD